MPEQLRLGLVLWLRLIPGSLFWLQVVLGLQYTQLVLKSHQQGPKYLSHS